MTGILVMGRTGMLGSMLFYYLTKQGYEVFSTSRGKSDKRNFFFDAESPDFGGLKKFILRNDIGYIVNAIGVINTFCRDDNPEGVRRAIKVNAHFPHQLAEVSGETGAKAIQIATDCVYDGSSGRYVEDSHHNPLDVYGKTKSLGEVRDGSILNLRCSIVGPEASPPKVSLLEWFLSQDGEVNGFTHHRWNGVTTLRFAQITEGIIRSGSYQTLLEKSRLFHIVPQYILTKREMLETFKRVFNKRINIKPTDKIGKPVDRSLDTKFEEFRLSDIDFNKDVQALKDIMDRDFYAFQD